MVRMAGFSGNSPKRSRSRKRLNLLENCQDGRRRTGRESSKRVHDGEPLEIDVLILYFAGDPNSTLELIRTYCIARGSTQHGFGPSSCQTDSFTIAHHYATTKKPCDRSHFYLPTTPLLLTPERISSRPRWSLQQGFCGVPLPLMFPPEARPRDRLWRRGVQATSRRPALRSPETP